MVIEIRWKRYRVSNGSDVTMVNLLPMSCTSSVTCAFHGPPVSIATGKNKCVPLYFSYFAILLTAALSAVAPAVWEMGRCESIQHCDVPLEVCPVPMGLVLCRLVAFCLLVSGKLVIDSRDLRFSDRSPN